MTVVGSVQRLLTPNEGITQRYLKNWADIADKICFGHTKKIWDLDLLFGRAAKAISSLGIRTFSKYPDVLFSANICYPANWSLKVQYNCTQTKIWI